MNKITSLLCTIVLASGFASCKPRPVELGAEEKSKGAEIELLLKEKLEQTTSGLKYKVLKQGKGTAPKATDKVLVHYQGWLTNGLKFDSSVDRGQAISFFLEQVIPGWTEGVQLMQPGAKYLFIIPAELAYGNRDSGPIPAGSTLIFEVELLEVL